jgi:hypothetical protein
MRHRRIVLATICAAVCSAAVSVSPRSGAHDTGEDRDCADQCASGTPSIYPNTSNCYDVCVTSKEHGGCAISAHGP